MPALPRPARGRRAARGNALVFALMGLAISGIGAVAALQATRLRARHEAGAAEATLLATLRNATNAAILEQLPALQAGQPLEKAGTSVAPVLVDGVPTWRPGLDALRAMGYLPPQWQLQRSALNNAPYTVSFHLTPEGCAPADCSVDGTVLLAGPLRDGRAGESGAASDGAVIGPILTALGADAAVSLLTSPATLTGYGGSWAAPNPVAGQPAGVVAVRVGTLAAAWSPFVRIRDTRDPDLAGNLTVAGNTTFGGAGGTHLAQVNGSLQLVDPGGRPCVQLRPDGSVQVLCDGRVDAVAGRFTDGAGHVATITPTGVATTGRVQADDGLQAGAVTAFTAEDPTGLQVHAGDLFVRGADGHRLMRVGADGDIEATRDLLAGGNLQGRQLALTGTVAEGEACDGGRLALLAGGGLATCQSQKFRAVARYGTWGGACEADGVTAVDSGTGETLLCRGGRFGSLNRLVASRVLMATQVVQNGSLIEVQAVLPAGCSATASGGMAAIYLLPAIDQNSPSNSILNRIANWTGTGWRVALTDGDGIATASSAIAYIYCDY